MTYAVSLFAWNPQVLSSCSKGGSPANLLYPEIKLKG